MCNVLRARVCIAVILLVSALLALASVAGASGQAWVQSNVSGFGTAANNTISALAVLQGQLYAATWNDEGAQVWRTTDGRNWLPFTPDFPAGTDGVYDAEMFKDKLYIGTYHEGGGEIWRTDGAAWEVVATAGLGDSNNIVCAAFAASADHLYVATGNMKTGIEVWRSASGNAGSWQQVNSDGFGAGPSWPDATMGVFKGYIYVTADDQDNPRAELYRSSNGTSWQPVFTDGLGNADNTNVAAITEFNGYLYIGLRNTKTGGEVWRSSDGMSWTPVVTGGLGDVGNARPYGLIGFRNELYLMIGNFGTGAQVWRSANGVNWQPIMQDGWGDGNNWCADYYNKAHAVYSNSLFVGTINEVDGGEIWQLMPRQVFLPLALK